MDWLSDGRRPSLDPDLAMSRRGFANVFSCYILAKMCFCCVFILAPGFAVQFQQGRKIWYLSPGWQPRLSWQ